MSNTNKDFIKWVEENNLEDVQSALTCGADVHFANDHALRLSASRGYSEMVNLLLDNKADATAGDNAFILSALEEAAKNGHTRIVKILLGHNVNIKKTLALQYSAQSGHVEIVTMLLKSGAGLHANNDAALLCGVNGGHFEIVSILLEAGANVNVCDGASLRSSIEKVNFALTAKLLEYGAGVHCSDDKILKNLENNFNEELADILLPYCEEEFYHYFPEAYIRKKFVATKSASSNQ